MLRLTTNILNILSKKEVNSALDDYIHVRKSQILLTVCRLKKRVACQSFEKKMAGAGRFTAGYFV